MSERNATHQGQSPPEPGTLNGLTKRQRLLLDHQAHKSDRAGFDALYKEINKYLFTSRGRFLVSDHLKGDRRSRDSFDITAQLAARTCAAGIATGVTNAAREWFRLSTPDPDLAEFPTVKRWLHTVTERMRAVLLGSNFYQSMHVMYGDMAGYGTCPVLIEEDNQAVIRCYPFPVGSYWLANDASGRVNALGREFQMTVRQLVERYGFDNCSLTVQNAWRTGNLTGWHSVAHVIYPNPDYDANKLYAQFKPVASCTFELAAQEQDKFLRESGYDMFPVIAGRWDTTAEDAYATDCPGMTALADIKQLQHGAKRAMQGLDKQVSPPLVAPTTLRNQPVSQLMGGLTYDDNESTKGVRPMFQVDPKLRDLVFFQQQTREAIREAFYADLFRMTSYLDDASQSGQPKTAAEIGERREEKLMQLGPMLHNLDDGAYNPAIDRVFGIMLNREMIPEAPSELEGQDLKVEYLSIMHQAQKSAGLGQMERYVLFATQLAAAAADGNPVLDKINTDEALESYGEMAGVPPQIIRSDDDVAAIRDQRQQAAAAAQRAEQMQREAAAAKDLSETETGGETALTALLNGAEQTGGGLNG